MHEWKEKFLVCKLTSMTKTSRAEPREEYWSRTSMWCFTPEKNKENMLRSVSDFNFKLWQGEWDENKI